MQSYEKQGFHSGTPPPFTGAIHGSQSAGLAPSGTGYAPQVYIPTMAAQHHSTHLMQQPLHQVNHSVFLFTLTHFATFFGCMWHYLRLTSIKKLLHYVVFYITMFISFMFFSFLIQKYHSVCICVQIKLCWKVFKTYLWLNQKLVNE